ncbi:hypothetical protein [Teredinibacter franksiae]|uniref:hypothetical protein n=1 Tax=Teredinibacter franksiae TaxID=2761453 RepID=UPI001625D8D4|nr:hypothetical protein [Teredinibacter franksiae]
MTDNSPPKKEYMNTANSAKLVAYTWLNAKFFDELEYDPVQILAKAAEGAYGNALDVEFKTEPMVLARCIDESSEDKNKIIEMTPSQWESVEHSGKFELVEEYYEPITRLSKIPGNPGYSFTDLKAVFNGERLILPLASWSVFGVNK